MRTEGKADVLDITIEDSTLVAWLDKKGSQQVTMLGDAWALLKLTDGALSYFDASFDGHFDSQGIHHAFERNQLSAKANGTAEAIDITKLVVSNQAGHLSVAGALKLTNGVAWQLHGHADGLNTSALYANSPVMFTGGVSTTGLYKNNTLHNVRANIDGQILSHDGRVPTGVLQADVVGNYDKLTINQFAYQGQAGALSATGWVDISKGVAADINAVMTRFNLGQFVKGYDSQLDGELSATTDWRSTEQKIDIQKLDIQGTLKEQALQASGVVTAHLQLPDNLKAYWQALKKDTKARFDLDRITGSFQASISQGITQLGREANQLQADIAKQDASFRTIVKKLDVQDVIVRFGDNRLQMEGDEQKLAINIKAEALNQFVADVRGSVSGGLIVEGDDNRLPTIYSDIRLANISMPSFAARDVSIVGKVVNLGNANSAFVVQASNLVAAGQTLRQARLDIQGTQNNHNILLLASNAEMQVQTRLQGVLENNLYQGVLSEGRLQTRQGVLNQRQPAEVRYDIAQGELVMAAHCWQTLSATGQGNDTRTGSLCLQEKLVISPTAGSVDLVIAGLDTAVFTPMLPSDLSWRSRLNGKIKASWGKAAPEINAVLYSDNGAIGLRNEGLPDTTLPYERVSLIVQTVPAGLKLRTDISIGNQGGGYADVTINPYAEGKPIAGALALNGLQLGVLRPFFPAIQTLSGTVEVAGGVGGTLSKPLFYGNASLTEGYLALVDVPINLSDIQLNASIRGMQASVEGEFKGGSGTGTLSGEVDWQQELQAKMTVIGEKLALSSPPLLAAEVSPHLEIIARPTQKYVSVQGVVSVPSATIRPPETTSAVVEQSEDVVVIDRRVTGDVANILASVTPWSINADIGLDLGDDVVFRGFGAKLPLAGALHLTQRGQGAMRARGVIQVSERTTVDAIGQNLELNYAQIRFNGDVMNPRLSIEAVREIESQTVGVRVTGTVAEPNISVFNDAGLTEQQAMNALVTGSLSESTGVTQMSEESFRTRVTNSLAAAGLSLGLQGTRGITNQIGRALGLESLTVDASGSASDANVNITGYITPDLYIRYGVGVFNAETTLSLHYQLTQRIYVEVTSAVENIVDVVYRWRF